MASVPLRRRLFFFEESLEIFVTYFDSHRQEKHRIKRYLFMFIWLFVQLLHTYRYYVEIYKLNPKLETWIVQGAVAYVVATALFYILLVYFSYDEQRSLVEWCETRKGFVSKLAPRPLRQVDLETEPGVSQAKISDKFQGIFDDVNNFSEKRFQQAEESSAKTTKRLAIMVFSAYLTLPITNPLLGYMTRRPYTLPFLLTLPYTPVTGMWTYCINWCYQVLELVVGCAAFFIFYSICTVVVIHLTAQMDVMIRLCEVLKSDSVYEKKKRPGLSLSVLRKINLNLEIEGRENETRVMFRKIESDVMEEWIRLFVKIHNDLAE